MLQKILKLSPIYQNAFLKDLTVQESNKKKRKIMMRLKSQNMEYGETIVAVLNEEGKCSTTHTRIKNTEHSNWILSKIT
jgi:hypothetical protein